MSLEMVWYIVRGLGMFLSLAAVVFYLADKYFVDRRED